MYLSLLSVSSLSPLCILHILYIEHWHTSVSFTWATINISQPGFYLPTSWSMSKRRTFPRTTSVLVLWCFRKSWFEIISDLWKQCSGSLLSLRKIREITIFVLRTTCYINCRTSVLKYVDKMKENILRNKKKHFRKLCLIYLNCASNLKQNPGIW